MSVWVTFGVLVFLGLSAVAGGVELTFGIWGTGLLPSDAPDRIPMIDSWLVPGPVLGIGFGLGSLAAAYGMLRKPPWSWLGFAERLTGHHWSWVATILIGLAHIVWILLELIYLPGVSPLEALYGAAGTALVLLPMLAPVRGYLRNDTT